MIKEEIMDKPRKPITRRKSCICSECGKGTPFERKTMAIINAITHKKLLENEDNSKTLVNNQEMNCRIGIKAIYSKYSILS